MQGQTLTEEDTILIGNIKNRFLFELFGQFWTHKLGTKHPVVYQIIFNGSETFFGLFQMKCF